MHRTNLWRSQRIKKGCLQKGAKKKRALLQGIIYAAVLQQCAQGKGKNLPVHKVPASQAHVLIHAQHLPLNGPLLQCIVHYATEVRKKMKGVVERPRARGGVEGALNFIRCQRG